MEAVNYDKKKCRNHVLGGCPGALGKLASKGMFRTLFGPAERGGYTEQVRPPLEQSTIYGMKLHPGSQPRWRL